MPMQRAGKLATELGTTPELVLEACRRAGLSAFSEQTPLDDRETQRVRHAIDDAPSPDLLPAPPTSPDRAAGAPRPRRRLPAWAIAPGRRRARHRRRRSPWR